MMVMTVLEAEVSEDNWPLLQKEYNEATARSLDPGLVQTFLLHDLRAPARWRIATVWSSREALDTMRQSGQTPRGVLIFRAAGAEPALSVFAVTAETTAPA